MNGVSEKGACSALNLDVGHDFIVGAKLVSFKEEWIFEPPEVSEQRHISENRAPFFSFKKKKTTPAPFDPLSFMDDNLYYTIQASVGRALPLTIYNTLTGVLREVTVVPISSKGADGTPRVKLGAMLRPRVDPVPSPPKGGFTPPPKPPPPFPRDKYEFGFEVTGVVPKGACAALNIDVAHEYIVAAQDQAFNKKTTFEPPEMSKLRSQSLHGTQTQTFEKPKGGGFFSAKVPVFDHMPFVDNNFFYVVQTAGHARQKLALTLYNTRTNVGRDVHVIPPSAKGKDGKKRSRLGVMIRREVDPVPYPKVKKADQPPTVTFGANSIQSAADYAASGTPAVADSKNGDAPEIEASMTEVKEEKKKKFNFNREPKNTKPKKKGKKWLLAAAKDSKAAGAAAGDKTAMDEKYAPSSECKIGPGLRRNGAMSSSLTPRREAFARSMVEGVFESVFQLFEPVEPELNATWLVLDKDSAITSRLAFRRDVIVFDCAKMHHDYHTRKMPLKLILEEARRVLINCLVKGKIMVLRLSTCCPDFLHTFNDGRVAEEISRDTGLPLSRLPEGFMLHQGKPLLRGKWPAQLIRRVDRTHNQLKLTTKPEESTFQIILSSELEYDDLDEMLFDHKLGLPPKFHFDIWDRGVAYETIVSELGLVQDEELTLI